MAFNVVDHFYNEWKINNYSTDDAVEYISIEKIITIDSYDTNDGLSYAGSYVTQYIIRPVYKTRGDKQFFSVDFIRNYMRIGTWKPIRN